MTHEDLKYYEEKKWTPSFANCMKGTIGKLPILATFRLGW